MDTAHFFIAQYDPRTDTLSSPRGVSPAGDACPPVIEVCQADFLTVEVIRTGTPLLITKGEILARRAEREGTIPVRAPELWLGVPLKTRGRTIGVMTVQSYEDAARYDRTDLQVMVSVADQVALAIERRKVDEPHLQEALRESEAHLQQLFDHMADGVAVYQAVDDGQNFVFVEVNRPGQSLSRIHLREVAGRRITEVFPSVERMGLLDVFRRVWRTGQPERHPLTAYADGRVTQWVENYVFKLPSGLIGAIYSDTSEKHQAAEQLRESREVLQAVLNAIPVRVFWKDRNLVYLGCNTPFARDAGFERPEELVGKDDHAMGWREQAELYRADDRAVIESGEARLLIEEPQTTPSGEQIHLLTSKVPLRDAAGAIVGVLGTYHDITEHKRAEAENAKLEAQLLQAQKMESVGRLAGGVAHDFNNMLGVILGHAEMALDLVDPSQPLHGDLEEIRKAADRSANLTRQLLAFARKQTVSPQVLDLNETVEGMLKMLRRLIGEDIELLWRPAAGLWAVKVDPSQVDQILANLCVNARDAIVGVGTITIETGVRAFDNDYCARHADCVPGEYVSVAVSDDGCGMEKDTLNRLFEPFFTTKGVGQGTGLGLATVYGIVKQNGGFIHVDSEPARGTRFEINLPRYLPKDGSATERDGSSAETAAESTGTPKTEGGTS